MTEMLGSLRLGSLSEYPGYVFVSDGRVLGKRGWLNPFVAKASENYSYYRVRLSVNGKVYNRSVHQLVARTFLGDPPTPKHEVAHNNGNSMDNRLANLRWATHADNCADKIEHGTRQNGENNGFAKLTDAAVIDIRDQVAAGATQRSMAKKYGIGETHASRIVKRTVWTHV